MSVHSDSLEALTAENAKLKAEVDRLGHEIMAYQVQGPYDVGHEHGRLAERARFAQGKLGRESLVELCDKYLLDLHCTLWGQAFEVISPAGRAEATAWLAEAIRGALAQASMVMPVPATALVVTRPAWPAPGGK